MLRGLMSFDHCVPAAINNIAATTAAGGNLIPYNGYGFVQDPGVPALTTAGSSGSFLDSEGTWMYAGLTGSGSTYSGRGFAIPLAKIMDWTTRASYLGFRIKLPSSIISGSTSFPLTYPASAATVVPFLSIGKPSVTTLGGILNILNIGNFPAAIYPLGVSVYVEIKIDRTNKLITMWADDVMFSQVPFDPTTIDTTCYLTFGWTGNYTSSVGGNGWAALFKDMYFIDDTQDSNLPNSRLGPMSATQMVLAAAVGSGWTSSDSQSLLTDLTSAITISTGSLNTPLVTSPAGVQTTPELDLQFSNSFASGQSILGAGFVAGLQRPPAVNSQGVFSIKDAATPTPNVKSLLTAFPATPSAGISARVYAGAITSAPDGSALTPAKLSALTLAMTSSLAPLAV